LTCGGVFPTSPSNRWRLVFLALASTICANAGWGRHQQVAWSRWPSIISVSRDVKLRRELLSHLVRQMLAFSGTQIWDSSDHQKTNRQTNGGAQRFLRPGMTHPWSQLALNSHSTLSFASTTCAWTRPQPFVVSRVLHFPLARYIWVERVVKILLKSGIWQIVKRSAIDIVPGKRSAVCLKIVHAIALYGLI